MSSPWYFTFYDLSSFPFISKRYVFPPVEAPWCAASGRPTLNLERRLDHDGHPLAITTADAVAASGVPPWNWRETPGNGKLMQYEACPTSIMV